MSLSKFAVLKSRKNHSLNHLAYMLNEGTSHFEFLLSINILSHNQYSGKNLSSEPAEVQALVINAFYFFATQV